MSRVMTGIDGLDEILHGGFLPQTANVVEGAPGTGKSTLGMQFIYNGIVKYNEPGIIVTFEEFPQQYYRDAASFGWDFKALESQNKLRIVMTSPDVLRRDLEMEGGLIQDAIRGMDAKRIVVDSISQFRRLAVDSLQLRELEYKLINALKREGLTSILTRESKAIFGEERDIDDSLAFVADSYILLRFVEIESEIRKALVVLKMRGSDHDKRIRQFEIVSNRGFVVQSVFQGQEKIMSGMPDRVQMERGFEEAFVRDRPAERSSKAFGKSKNQR